MVVTGGRLAQLAAAANPLSSGDLCVQIRGSGGGRGGGRVLMTVGQFGPPWAPFVVPTGFSELWLGTQLGHRRRSSIFVAAYLCWSLW